MGWGPTPGKSGQKKQKQPHLQWSPSEPPTENENRFFQIQAEDLLNPRMVWIAL